MVTDTTRWWGWGDPSVSIALESRPELAAYLKETLSLQGNQGLPIPQLEEMKLPESTLDSATQAALSALMDAQPVDVSKEGRVRHAAGKSYIDLVHLRRNTLPAAPDGVLYPTNPQQVAKILNYAADSALSVVPFGGGTSVVGGVHPYRSAGTRAVLTMDLRGMTRVEQIDRKSLSAVVEAGVLGPALEHQLEQEGLTLGHFPQSFEFSTLGGWIAARSAGQCSTGYGRVDQLVLSMDVLAPGRAFTTAPSIPSATGPSLAQLFIGSEGVLGVITRARVLLHPRPERRRLTSVFFRDFAAGVDAVRHLAQEGPTPTMIRLSDPTETRMLLAGSPAPKDLFEQLKRKIGLWYLRKKGGSSGAGCLLILGYEGTRRQTRADRNRALSYLRRRTMLVGGEGPARSWFSERFRHPYMRDSLMSAGVLVETLETGTTWDRLDALYQAVRGSLEQTLAQSGAPGLVLCHISHIYPEGASLYYTVLARARSGQEVEQWTALKRAATDAITRQGGALSHHHGIGADHKPWMEQQHGPAGVALLASLKQSLDPAGVLNPGKLVEVRRP
jgi:alkyldihydroxyacetonephosphate synthase